MSNDSRERVDEWIVEIEGRLENPYNSHATRRPSMDRNIEEYPSIFGKWKSWDDFGASYIPETQKWIFVACMTHYFGLNVRSYLLYMQQKVDLAWSYYRGVDDQFRTTENRKRFIEHLLVNSCFLIFSLILFSREKEYDSWFEIINIDNPKGLSTKDIQNIIDFITQEPRRTICYILTMNYQIPWFVVEAIHTELTNLSKRLVTPIHKIALIWFDGLYPNKHPSRVDDGTIPESGFKHLLHVFHWSRTPDKKYLVDFSRISKWIGEFHIPSATGLRLSQIVFVKDEDGSVDVSYIDGTLSGVMQLTPWHLLDYSTKLYESLLIFEREYRDCGIPFATYVTCMSSLLKTEEDVRVLRANGIIPSTSFDDKDVLHFVQVLKTFIPDGLKTPNELVILEEKVNEHYQRSAYRVYGEFKQRYCSTPWITISVIAAILLFVLTFIQTIVSILSYEKQ